MKKAWKEEFGERLDVAQIWAGIDEAEQGNTPQITPFRVDEELKSLIPPLLTEEQQQLEQNLRADGCRDALVVWKEENILVDGHNRFEICQKHHIPFDVAYRGFSCRDAVKLWIVNNQLGRRNLPPYQRIELVLPLGESLQALAKANQGRRTDLSQISEKGGNPEGGNPEGGNPEGGNPEGANLGSAKSAQFEDAPQGSQEDCINEGGETEDRDYHPVDTVRQLSQIANVSIDTFAKGKRIHQNAIPEIKALLIEDDISMNAADIVAKLPAEKQLQLAVQGGYAVRKAAVQIQHEEKKAKEARLREEAKDARAEEDDETQLEAQSQILRDKYKKELGTAYGQLWEIHSKTTTHRLFIGDATNAEHVAALMNRRVGDIIVIDPPYNVGYKGKTEHALDYGDDNLPDDEFEERIRRATLNLFNHAKPGALMYMWHSDKAHLQFELGLRAAGWLFKQGVIWAKQKPTQNWHGYNYQHESCMVSWKPGANQNWWGGKDKNTVWMFDKPHANREHPTSKPVELYENALRDASREGDLLVDTFCGSGTAIEAAHRMGRTCYALEKDAGYAAVILKRMQKLGLKLELITEVVSFDDLTS